MLKPTAVSNRARSNHHPLQNDDGLIVLWHAAFTKFADGFDELHAERFRGSWAQCSGQRQEIVPPQLFSGRVGRVRDAVRAG